LAVVCLYLAFKDFDTAAILEVIKNANYYWIAASLVVSFMSHATRGLRWRIMLESLGYKIRLDNVLSAVFFNYFANIFAPRFGEVARCTATNRVEKIPFNVMLGTIILERTLDIIILFSLIVLTGLINVELFGNFFLELISSKAEGTDSSGLQTIGLTLIIGAVVGLGGLYFTRSWWMKFAIAQKVMNFLKGIMEGFVTVVKMKRKWAFIGYTLLIWFCYYFMTYLAFFALESTATLKWFDGFFVLVLGGLGMAAPTQGGIGAYHWVMSRGLEVYEIAIPDGLAFATLLHGAQSLFLIVLGILSVVWLYINFRAGRHHGEENSKVNAS